MASEAEVDLIISTADTLPDLERDLNRIIRIAENGAPELDVQAAVDVDTSLSRAIAQLRNLVADAEDSTPDIEIIAVANQVRSLEQLQNDLTDIVRIAENNVDNVDVRAELDRLNTLPQIQAQLRSVISIAEANAPPIEVEVEIDRDGTGERRILGIGKALAGAIGPLGKFAAGIGKAGLAAGSAAPLLAGIVTSLQSIAPAAAVAVPALLSVVLVSTTLKLAMQGVGDAVSTAFDPEASPEDLEKAMKNLAPSAKAFVTELRSMRGALKEVQQSVQDNLFQGFDKALRGLKEDVLPDVAQALQETSGELNTMALGAADAARNLGTSGVLGEALSGTTLALRNLTKIPAQLVTGLGQIAAAAAPSFGRLTAAADRAATGISEKLTRAFETGALERAIDQAIVVIKQLGRIAGNIFEGLGNIINGVSADGEGLFQVAEKITQAFADVTATDGFQRALAALSETAGVLVDEGLKVVVQVLEELGPIFEALAPPVQQIIRLLGDSLGRIFEELGPVLVTVAEAFAKLIPVLEPFVVLATDLVVAILPGLIPLFETLGRIFEAVAPFAKQLADNIGAQLVPFLETLANEVLPKLLPFFGDLAEKIFPKLTEILVELEPELTKLGEAMAELLVEAVPLIIELAKLAYELGVELEPLLAPLTKALIFLVEAGLKLLHSQLVEFTIPAIRILVNLLQGDTTAAFNGIRDLIGRVALGIATSIVDMKNEVIRQFVNLVGSGARLANDFKDQVSRAFTILVDLSIRKIQEIPDRARASLANSIVILYSAGQDLIRGFINGIASQIGALRDAASRAADAVTGQIKGLLGIQSPSRVMIEVGTDTMDGFLIGLGQRIPALKEEMRGIAAIVPTFALPDGRAIRVPQPALQDREIRVFIGNEELNPHINRRLESFIATRDRVNTQGVRR